MIVYSPFSRSIQLVTWAACSMTCATASGDLAQRTGSLHAHGYNSTPAAAGQEQ